MKFLDWLKAYWNEPEGLKQAKEAHNEALGGVPIPAPAPELSPLVKRIVECFDADDVKRLAIEHPISIGTFSTLSHQRFGLAADVRLGCEVFFTKRYTISFSESPEEVYKCNVTVFNGNERASVDTAEHEAKAIWAAYERYTDRAKQREEAKRQAVVEAATERILAYTPAKKEQKP